MASEVVVPQPAAAAAVLETVSNTVNVSMLLSVWA